MDNKENIDEDVSKISKRFDELYDNSQFKEMENLLPEAISISQRELNDVSKVSINYTIGTAYGNILELYNFSSKKYIETLEKELYYLRKAQLIEKNTSQFSIGLKVQLYVNLGNAYALIGRTNESIEAYMEAIKIAPDFGMATGNLATSLIEYANCLYDEHHKTILYHKSYEYFNKCFEDKIYLEDYAQKRFTESYHQILQIFRKDFLNQELKFYTYDLGNEEERSYREWVSENSLFLNPINDIENNTAIMQDCLHLPDMIFNIKDGQDYKYHGLFNEIKQEFISSRYIYYETILPKEEEHFSDKNTYIMNTLDYSGYSLYKWKIRMVFRSLYSLLDKIAFFVNEYMDIGIKERDVNFKSIWYKQYKKYKYKNPIIDKITKNAGLFGMYWIYKDFFESKKVTINPRIIEISNIRNTLEHKYLKIVDVFFENEDYLKSKREGEWDKLAFYISETEFRDICLWLLKTIRSLIISLIVTVNIEETNKKIKNSNKYIPSIPLVTIDDDWKL